MRKKLHLIGSVSFACISYFIWHFLDRFIILRSTPSLKNTIYSIFSIEISLFFIMILSSYIGGILPDILDPPFTKYHRYYAHSKIVLIVLIILWGFSLFILLIEENMIGWFIHFLLIGYISHLILDSFTPAGLQ